MVGAAVLSLNPRGFGLDNNSYRHHHPLHSPHLLKSFLFLRSSDLICESHGANQPQQHQTTLASPALNNQTLNTQPSPSRYMLLGCRVQGVRTLAAQQNNSNASRAMSQMLRTKALNQLHISSAFDGGNINVVDASDKGR